MMSGGASAGVVEPESKCDAFSYVGATGRCTRKGVIRYVRSGLSYCDVARALIREQGGVVPTGVPFTCYRDPACRQMFYNDPILGVCRECTGGCCCKADGGDSTPSSQEEGSKKLEGCSSVVGVLLQDICVLEETVDVLVSERDWFRARYLNCRRSHLSSSSENGATR